MHCSHDVRQDKHGDVKREISRSYKLPEDVDVSTIKSHLTKNGILYVSAAKKRYGITPFLVEEQKAGANP